MWVWAHILLVTGSPTSLGGWVLTLVVRIVGASYKKKKPNQN
jgi:hypothetical protein